MLREDRVVGLQFHGLNETNLPRGATLKRVELKVTPYDGGDGCVI